MNILIVSHSTIPAILYGGIERIIWWLGKELNKQGHNVTYLVNKGSVCPFGRVIFRDNSVSLESQVPEEIDIVHFHYLITGFNKRPYIVTIHGNSNQAEFPINSVFVSKDHAKRYNAEAYVYNGIDPEEYGLPDFNIKRKYFHFLGKAAWRIKNVKGAINVASAANEKLVVIGGSRLNIKMGFRFTPNLNVSFKGMLGGEKKNAYIRASMGLIFPVKWHEPFGIALIESLYFGCPVFGTPYGSLPEIVTEEMGVLSNSASVLADALKTAGDFDRKKCYQHVCDLFLSDSMANQYIKPYEKVLSGLDLNSGTPVFVQSQKFLDWID